MRATVSRCTTTSWSTTATNVGILPVLTYLSVNGGADNLSWIPRYDDTARVEDMTLS